MSNKFDLERSKEGVETLLRICKRRGRILVLMQNNPDPDSIASAAALKELVHVHFKKRVTIGYAGICGRAENRAMLNVLKIETRRITPDVLGKFKILCLVDTQPRSGNNALYTSRPAEIVIDHHLLPKRKAWISEFSDVRPDYGATSTIFYEYLLASNTKPSQNLATALFYGIQSDTQELGREASPADFAAFQELLLLADMKTLARIRRAPVPSMYFQTLIDGLANCRIAGKTIFCFLKSVESPEMIAEFADLMLRLDGIRTSVCYGVYEDVIYLSARAIDGRGNVAQRMKRIVSRLGTGGGHRTMAGGQIPLGLNEDKRLALVAARLIKIFASNKVPTPLLAAPKDTADDLETHRN